MELEIRDVSIAFADKHILQDVRVQVETGEFVTLIGTSGCGKSTLLNILAGVLTPTKGEIYVNGEPIQGPSSHFAYMPQNDLLLPWKTILDNVTLYAKIHHNQKAAKQQALKEFATFGLQGYEHAYPHELSGGMRQRAAFLRTALCTARIMLLDEPFGALDVITRHEMQDWLLQLRKKWNQTTLLVTHDIDEALYLSDRILILGGKPASIIKEINLRHIQKSREWLYEQSELRKEIDTVLRGQNDVA